MSPVTNLRGLYARVAADMGGQQLLTLLATLREEPEPIHPHVAQALDAFSEEARKRGLET